MHILHVAWEYPPLVYGGLGRHVGALATAQARAGHQVTVVAQTEGAPVAERIADVDVVRVPRENPDLPFTEETLLAWVAGLERAMTAAVRDLAENQKPDIVHGHDWMVTDTVTAAARLCGVPVVATFHATEAGRHQGWLPAQLSRDIHAVEHRLAHLAERLITCSAHMRWEVSRLFGVPESRVAVIPNGIDLSEWTTTAEARDRSRATYAPTGPLIVFAGRLEWEKGVHTLLDAMRQVVRSQPSARLVVAGKGGKEADLRRHALRLNLGEAIRFTGWLPEADLHALIAAADVAVVPSLYEPFGLVALEAAALGTPVIVARTGGLAEISDNGRVAATFPPGDPAALARTIDAMLSDPQAAQTLAGNARRALATTYDWDRIALATVHTYEAALASPADAPHPPDAPLVIPEGNLLVPAAE